MTKSSKREILRSGGQLDSQFITPKPGPDKVLRDTPLNCNNIIDNRVINLTSPDADFNRHLDLYNTENTTFFTELYTKIKCIGSGSFGEVHLAESKEDPNIRVAVKKNGVKFSNEAKLEQSLNEVKILRILKGHENIIELKSAWSQSGHTYLVMEYCEYNLAQISEIKAMTKDEIYSYTSDTLKGLKYMHDMEILHLDIKLENILVTNDGVAKLADFGISIQKGTEYAEKASHEGDGRYLDSETLNGVKEKSSDMYALGVCLLEMSSDIILPNTDRERQLIRTGKFPEELKGDIDVNIICMTERCICVRGVDRITAGELLNMIPRHQRPAKRDVSVIVKSNDIMPNTPLLQPERMSKRRHIMKNRLADFCKRPRDAEINLV
uniref:Protein kinase domain-containing protein n=1 Tax=Rhabditophanes sp. KR3021 TaxID=114890 RepID=A0AC35TVB5_9BILA